MHWSGEGWHLGIIDSFKDQHYCVEYGRRAASLPSANDLVIRHCGKRRLNDMAEHDQFPLKTFGSKITAKEGSWALLKAQPRAQLAAQPAKKPKGRKS